MKINFFLQLLFIGLITFSVLAFTDMKNEPKSVALNFLNALKAKEYTKAKQFGTEATSRIIDMLEADTSDTTKTKTPKIKSTILQAKIDGDKCVVTYMTSDLPNEERTMNLAKIDGKWLVEMTKDDTDE